jgi:hypothetical protein
MATHYTGAQWIVNDEGIESRDGCYNIVAEDLDKDVGEGGWIGHMSEKDWVDVEDFKRAVEIARRVFK